MLFPTLDSLLPHKIYGKLSHSFYLARDGELLEDTPVAIFVVFGVGSRHWRAGNGVKVACASVSHQRFDDMAICGGPGDEFEISCDCSRFDGHHAARRGTERGTYLRWMVLFAVAYDVGHPWSISSSVAFSSVFTLRFHSCLTEIQRLAYSQR